MGERSKKIIVGGAVLTVPAVVLAICDLAMGFPYGGAMVMDILFILAGLTILYMAWDAYQELK